MMDMTTHEFAHKFAADVRKIILDIQTLENDVGDFIKAKGEQDDKRLDGDSTKQQEV